MPSLEIFGVSRLPWPPPPPPPRRPGYVHVFVSFKGHRCFEHVLNLCLAIIYPSLSTKSSIPFNYMQLMDPIQAIFIHLWSLLLIFYVLKAFETVMKNEIPRVMPCIFKKSKRDLSLSLPNLSLGQIVTGRNGFCRTKEDGQVYNTLARFFFFTFRPILAHYLSKLSDNLAQFFLFLPWKTQTKSDPWKGAEKSEATLSGHAHNEWINNSVQLPIDLLHMYNYCLG